MESQVALLDTEVQKIITAPFIVSLKRLHSILEQFGEYSEQVLTQWIRFHHEEVPQLACAIVQGVLQWPYVWEIVGRLSCVKYLRDSFLNTSDTFLSQLLDKTIKSDEAFACHASLCLRLLQEPLDPDIPLPQSAQELLWKFFDRAVKTPNTVTVEALYLLLDGGCRELLDILPKQGLQDLQAEMTTVMRSAKGIEEQSMSILCLAVIAKTIPIQSDPGRAPLGSTASPTLDSDLAAEQAERFFVGNRALKTMHLLALQVIYACRNEKDVSIAQRIKPIRLSRQILMVIAPRLREQWSQSNVSIFRKLQEKLSLDHLPAEVHVEASAFSSMLSPAAGSLPKSTISSYQGALLNIISMESFKHHLDCAISTSLAFFSPHLDQLFWNDFFQVYKGRLSQKNENVYLDSAFLSNLLTNLEGICASCSKTRKSVIQGACSSDISGMLHNMLSTNLTLSGLLKDLCASLLRIGASAEKEEPNFPTSLTLHLITVLQQSTQALSLQKAPQGSAVTVAPLDLMQQPSNIHAHGASHRWRERLQFQLGNEARHRHDSIVALVGQICHDFEERCDNVEAPLRAKQAEYEELATDHASLRARVEDLECETKDRKSQIIDYQAAESLLKREKADVREENYHWKIKYDEMDEEFRSSKIEGERALALLHQDVENLKLNHQARIACQIEQLDEAASEIDNLGRRLSEAQSETRVEEERANDLRLSLDETKATLEAALESEKKTNMETERSLTHSREYQALLERKMEEEKVEASVRLEQANEAFKASEQTYEARIAALRVQNDLGISNIRSDVALERQSFESRLHELSIELTHAEGCHRAQTENQEQENRGLRRRVDMLAEACRDKEYQLQEAQQMKLRLVNALGIDEDSLAPARGNLDVMRRRMSTKERVRRFRTADQVSGPINAEGDIVIQPSTEDFSTSEPLPTTEAEVSPKRAKPRTNFRKPQMHPRTSIKNHQMSTNASGRRSMDLRGLEDASLSSVNRRDSTTRRRSEYPRSPAGLEPDFSLPENGDETVDQKASDEAAPGGQENAEKIFSTSDRYYDGLAAEDFDGSTVEL